MTKLQDIAAVIRSKNAGPTRLTLDIMFNNEADYQRVVKGTALTAAKVAKLYGRKEADVKMICYPPSNAIKFVLPRPVAGDPGERDLLGAQQHTFLLEVEV
ncbi:MAG: DUF4387 domain-containing protein [Pseudomonadota bacterium]